MKPESMIVKTVLAFFVLIVSVLSSRAQFLDSDSSDFTHIKDTLCFKYHFVRGDTLIYKVISADSIVINFGKPLLKTRMEIISIVCDSVGRNGHYYLSQRLLLIKSKEANGSQTADRNESPWIDRVAWYEIDSTGRRYAFGVDDSTKVALTPGGAFQPFLIIDLGETPCKPEKESWIVDIFDNIPENGVPVPIIKQSSLFRADTTLDTLGYRTNRLNFVKTARGAIKMLNFQDTIKVTSTINSYGVMDIDSKEFIPVHYFMTQEQKLQIHLPDGEEPGSHSINSYFTLLEKKGLSDSNRQTQSKKKAKPEPGAKKKTKKK